MSIEQKILRSLAFGDKSTKELMTEIIDLSDRAQTSLLLNALAKAKWIKKVGQKWQAITTPEEAVADVDANSVPQFVSGCGDVYALHDDSPLIPSKQEQTLDLNCIFALQEHIHEDASLIIKKDEVIVAIDNVCFRVKTAEDVEACLRMCDCYMGKAA